MVTWVLIILCFVSFGAWVLINSIDSRNAPPQAVQWLGDRPEDQKILETHPNIFVCPKLGDNSFSTVIRQRKFGWDPIPLSNLPDHHYQEAISEAINSERCPIIAERGHKLCYFYPGSQLVVNYDWPVGGRYLDLAITVNVIQGDEQPLAAEEFRYGGGAGGDGGGGGDYKHGPLGM